MSVQEHVWLTIVNLSVYYFLLNKQSMISSPPFLSIVAFSDRLALPSILVLIRSIGTILPLSLDCFGLKGEKARMLTDNQSTGVGPTIGSLIAVVFYKFIKMLEYEMANPGADGDPLNDPTQNPEKRAEMV